jgi:hypothetical protein
LQAFAPLTGVEGVELVSLQKGPGLEQLDELSRRLRVFRPEGELDSEGGAFVASAALMKCLDLMVCVDTSACHLAGALGVPVWVALSARSDWRWLRRREDTVWYPSMRLFRQRVLGVWDEVFARMAEDLGRMVQEQGIWEWCGSR